MKLRNIEKSGFKASGSTLDRRSFFKHAGIAAGIIAVNPSPQINNALGAIKVTAVETIVLKFPTEKPIADAIHVLFSN